MYILNRRVLLIFIIIFVVIVSLVDIYSRYFLATLLACLKHLLVISYYKLKRSTFRYYLVSDNIYYNHLNILLK